MQIIKKIAYKSKNLLSGDIPVIVFFGDSVTQGCFEIYMENEDKIETVFEAEYGFHSYVAKILGILYPNVPVTIVNAGISGDNAVHACSRLEKDVLSMNPDIVIVSFGLNDCGQGIENIGRYKETLTKIFEKIKANGSEAIFMTQNMMNTEISCHIKEKYIKNIAADTMKRQNEGILAKYFEAAKKAAEACNVKVCDVYAKWQTLYENGVNTTNLLANKINHPSREMNYLSAFLLVEAMMEEKN